MKRNIVANVLGTVISFALSLMAVPIQLRLLGAEAFGLLGLLATIQLILVLFDFGLSSSVVREIAADQQEGIRADIAQTGAAIYWLVAFAVGLILFLAAEWIATRWLNAQTLSPESLTQAIRIIAIYVVFMWPVGHYANVLFGLGRLDWVNALRVAVAFLSQVGGIIIILATRDLQAFLAWLALSAAISALAHAAAARRLLPEMAWLPTLALPVIRRIWRTSLDMNAVSTASIIYTQADKLLMSALLPLNVLGYYNLAYRLMLGISMAPTAISSSALPTLTGYVTAGNHAHLRSAYNRIAQLALYLLSGLALGMVFFGWDVLAVWTTPENAQAAFRALGLLALGTLLNAVTAVGYYLMLAAGKTRRLMWIYVGGLPFYGLALLAGVLLIGIEGAAFALNIYSLYLILTLFLFIQRTITVESPVRWLNRQFTPFVLLAVVCFGAARLLVMPGGQPWLGLAMGMAAGLVYLLAGLFFLHPDSRNSIMNSLSRLWRRVKT